MTWEKNLRVIVAHGPHAGARGRLLRDLGRGEWLVKFDHRFAGTAVAVRDLAVEREDYGTACRCREWQE